MPNRAGSLELLTREVGRVLVPLERRLTVGDVRGLFAELGTQFPPELTNDGAFTAALGSGAAAAGGIPPLIAQLTAAVDADDTALILLRGGELLARIAAVIAAIGGVAARLRALPPALPGMAPAQVTDFADNLRARLLDYLAVCYLEARQPVLTSILALIGIVERRADPGVPGDPSRPPFTVKRLRLARLERLLHSPLGLAAELYGWGTPTFDGVFLLQRVQQFLADLEMSSRITPAPLALDAYLFGLRPDTASVPRRLIATLNVPIPDGLDVTLPLAPPTWTFRLQTGGRFPAGLRATVTPPADVSLAPADGTVQGQLLVQVSGQSPDPSSPFVLVGQTGGGRIEARSIAIGFGVRAAWNTSAGSAAAELVARAAIAGGRAVIDLSGGDAFVRTVSGGPRLEANVDFDALWSPQGGLRLEGSSGIELALPTHVTVGPIEIQTIYLRLGLDPDGSLPLELAGAFAAGLGPLKATVDRLGLIVRTAFPTSGGNLGPVNLALAFKPPNGVGLAVDAGVVKGGGFLYIDAERGEYAGALDLVFSGFLALKAIGIITTRMPDGSSGFSLLIIITAEFGTGIQLGFGFTLLAVGGLLGLNRTMRLQALAEGVRTGAVNNIMFPRDVIANAPRIISDLRAFFPPQQGRFLIGPMAKLGWGTPTLVSLSVGIIIEIPGNIAIIGVLRVAIPADDLALIVLQVNFIGALEFDRQRLWFFASLFESRILFVTIEGEIGVLAAFGADANFVIAVGGFHPQFNPPPLPFPVPRRIAVNILNESFARIRIEGYFAVTTSSVQFGARAEAFFGFSALSVEGHITFDALLQFSPFYFIVAISASFSLKVFGLGLFGIRVRFSLEGPSPYRAKGSGGISFLFFDIDVDFDITWGERRDTSLPPIAVMPLLKAEFDKQVNWQARLPAGANLLVSLRRLDPAEAALVLHPVGTLRVSQRAVPLDVALDRVGSQKPSDAKRFALAVASGGLAKRADVDELFAPAQFQDFDDAAKLSKPAYEPRHGGIELSVAGAQLASGTMVKRVVRYDLITIDTNARRSRRRFFVYTASLFSHFLKGASVTHSSLSAFQKAKLAPFAEKVAVRPETYTVAFQSTNRAFDGAASFASEAMARDFMQGQAARDPGLADALHVIPAYEVVA